MTKGHNPVLFIQEGEGYNLLKKQEVDMMVR